MSVRQQSMTRHKNNTKQGGNMKNGRYVEDFGTIKYFKDDQLHSYNDKSSICWEGGDKYWHQNGQLHRLTGPAVINYDGWQAYFINGVSMSKEEWENHPERKKYKLQQVLNRVLREHK
jgi:hypothetical protein